MASKVQLLLALSICNLWLELIIETSSSIYMICNTYTEKDGGICMFFWRALCSVHFPQNQIEVTEIFTGSYPQHHFKRKRTKASDVAIRRSSLLGTVGLGAPLHLPPKP